MPRARFSRNLGRAVGRLHRGVLQLIALDQVRIDERPGEARGDPGLIERGFNGPVRAGEQDKTGSHAAASDPA